MADTDAAVALRCMLSKTKNDVCAMPGRQFRRGLTHEGTEMHGFQSCAACAPCGCGKVESRKGRTGLAGVCRLERMDLSDLWVPSFGVAAVVCGVLLPPCSSHENKTI